MTNAKEEFLEHTADKFVLCAILTRVIDYRKVSHTYNLKVSYTREELQHFLALINFQYDSGYGNQELEGTIWYDDGSWSTRAEYDGSEWWHHNKLPDIPFELRTRG